MSPSSARATVLAGTSTPQPGRRWERWRAAWARSLPLGAAFLLVATLLLALGAATGGPAGAAAGRPVRNAGQPAPPIGLTIVEQTPIVPADGELVLRLDVPDLVTLAESLPALQTDAGSEPDPEAESIDVVVTIHSRLESADQLDQEPATPLNRLPRRTLQDYEADPDGLVTIVVPIRAGPADDELDRIFLPDPGVYPVTVELRSGVTVLTSVTTFLLRDQSAEAASGGETEAGPSPTLAPTALVVGALASADSIERLVDVLEAAPTAPVTVVLGAAALDRLERDPALAGQLRSAAGPRIVVAPPEPPLDPSSLAAIGRIDLYQAARDRSLDRLTGLGFTTDPAVVLIDRAQTAQGADGLAALGVASLIQTDPGPEPSRATIFTSGGAPLGVVALDPVSGELRAADLGPDDDEVTADGMAEPAVAAQRFLARLYLDADPSPILAGSLTAPLDPSIVAALDDAAATGALPLVPVGSAAPTDGVSVLAPTPAVDLQPIAGTLLTIDQRLATYSTMYVGGPDRPDGYRWTLLMALDPDRDPADRMRALDALEEQLGAELAVVTLPGNQSVTLTARSVSIPLTILNTSTGSRQVLLRFNSDKIVVAQDGALITIEPGTSSIDIDVEARSLGATPLEVLVLSPDGREVLASSRFQVRSTAIPGLGLGISGVGLVLLASWWYLNIRKHRTAHPSRGGGSGPRPDPEPGPERDGALARGSV